MVTAFAILAMFVRSITPPCVYMLLLIDQSYHIDNAVSICVGQNTRWQKETLLLINMPICICTALLMLVWWSTSPRNLVDLLIPSIPLFVPLCDAGPPY